MADTAGARIEPLSDFELDTVASGNGVRKLNAKILLTSFDSGSYRLPSPLFIVISGGKADTLKTERPVLSVNTLQIDTAGYVIKGYKGKCKISRNFQGNCALPADCHCCCGNYIFDNKIYKVQTRKPGLFRQAIVQDPPPYSGVKKARQNQERETVAGRQAEAVLYRHNRRIARVYTETLRYGGDGDDIG